MTVTWNAADKGPSTVLSNGGSTASVNAAGAWSSVRATIPQAQDAAYFQIGLAAANAYGSFVGLAAANMALTNYPGSSGDAAAVECGPTSLSTNPFHSGFFTVVNHPSGPCAVGDRIGVIVRRDLGKAWLSRNGVIYSGGDPNTGANPWVTFPVGAVLYPITAQYQPGEASTLYADAGNVTNLPAGFAAWSGSTPSGDYSAYPQGSTAARQRVLGGTAVVYVDVVNGSDAHNGSTPALAFKTLQAAVDAAQDNFDVVSNPSTWFYSGSQVYKPGVIVEMAPAPASTPYLLPHPLALTGMGPAGMIVLRGGPNPSLATAANYNIYASNPLQGLTAQSGASLLCEGFSITGDVNCTMINTLEQGKIAVCNVRVGGNAAGPVGGLGAAGISLLDVLGPISLYGGNFFAVFEAIEGSMLNFNPGASVSIENAMNFGTMMVLGNAQAWTQGAPISWNLGAGTGRSYNVTWQSFLGFGSSIPGSPGATDGTCVVL